MSDSDAWVAAVRSSHDRFVASVDSLGDATRPSYASEWTVADVASHLGSQSEIFELFLDAGLTGSEPPTPDAFGPIWAEWNAKPPAQQITDSVAVNEAFVSRVEALTPEERSAVALTMFGMELDLAGVLALRLGEHALHTWDIAVAGDPTATIAPDAVELLIDKMPAMASRSGKPATAGQLIAIETTEPSRRLTLTTGPEVSLASSDDSGDGPALDLPAEALVRLVYGRLDAAHTPAGLDADLLDNLRSVFPGF